MALTFIAKDPATDDNHCPTVWVDKETQKIVLQGEKISDAKREECLRTGSIPDYEDVIELPFRMIPAIREACDVAERSIVH